ncbi:hypothetical protein D3C71_1642090 [compost metagenome]
MNEVTRRMRYGSKITSSTKPGSNSSTGRMMRVIWAPPSTSMQMVMPSSSIDEPKSGCISSRPTSRPTTPTGFNIACQVALTSSRKRTR